MAKRSRTRYPVSEYGNKPRLDNFETLTPEERNFAVGESLNWYNGVHNAQTSRKIFLDYVAKKHKKDLPAVRLVSASMVSTYGNLVQVIADGANSPDLIARVDAYVKKLAAQGAPLVSKQKTVATEKAKGKVLSIQERVDEQVRSYIGAIEGEVDEFLLGECKKSKFNLYNWLQANEVKGVHTRKIKAFYQEMYAELREVVGGKDEQLNEGYAFLTKAKQKKFAQFVADLISSTDEWIANCNSKRKSRKRKVKTPEQIISKLNYKMKDDDYSIESVNPTTIIDAAQVWVFDTKTRFMYKYVSSIGMVVSGSTLKEFDKDQSFKKKIRESYCKQVLDDVVNGGKVKLRKSLDLIKAKEVAVTGRIGKEMVIVRIVK